MGTTPPKPVTRRTLWLAMALSVFTTLTIIAGAGAFLAASYWPVVDLPAQPLVVRLPAELDAQVRMPGSLTARVVEPMHVEVPLRETLDVPIKGHFQAQVQMDTEIPVEMDIRIDRVIPVHVALGVDTTVQTRVLGIEMSVPVKGRIPVELDLPVSLDVPIRERIPVTLDTPVTVQLDDRMRIPLDTRIEAQARLLSPVVVEAVGPISAVARLKDQPVTIDLQRTTLDVPFEAVRIERREGAPLWQRLRPPE